MTSINHLAEGFKTFRATTLSRRQEHLRHIVEQNITPTTLMITSCSLRVSPDILTSCNPGDLYVIRNIGGFVPPYHARAAGGTIAAIEYAVMTLKVENVVVLGHAYSDGVKMLMQEYNPSDKDEADPVNEWLNVAADARRAVMEQLKDKTSEEQERACEREVVLLSLRNLLGYPWVAERINRGEMGLYGWYVNLNEGHLYSFNPNNRMFELVE